MTRRFVEFLHPEGAPFSHGSGRLELAREIVSPSNPLTARVFVNRVWLHLLGVGLVGTPSDFGLRSDPPSHPELLDYLASEFIRNGWSVKKLIRLIVTSNTYRQASLDRPAAAGMDPENKWLWRANRKRHDFETVRDSLLSVSGRLDPKVGGPPVSFDQPRRTLYAFVDRMDLPSLYSTFDFPSPASTNPQRAQTTVAPQSLYLMNHPSIAGLSEALLHRPDVARLEDKKEKIRRVYALVLARSPDPQEEQLAMRFLEDSSAKAWSQWVHGLLMLNEFVFLD